MSVIPWTVKLLKTIVKWTILLGASSLVFAATYQFTITPPVQYVDNTPITNPIAYNMYGAVCTIFPPHPYQKLTPTPVASVTFSRSPTDASKYCYYWTAVDTVTGAESDQSNEIIIDQTVPKPVVKPKPPVVTRIS